VSIAVQHISIDDINWIFNRRRKTHDDVVSVGLSVYQFSLRDDDVEPFMPTKTYCPFISYIKRTDTMESLFSRFESILGSLPKERTKLAIICDRKPYYLSNSPPASPRNGNGNGNATSILGAVENHRVMNNSPFEGNQDTNGTPRKGDLSEATLENSGKNNKLC
jgi:hypothetical protein